MSRWKKCWNQLVSRRKKQWHRQQQTRALRSELLEARQLFAIALVGSDVVVTGNGGNDAVVVDYEVVGRIRTLAVTHSETRLTPIGLGVFTTKENFPLSSVNRVVATLQNGSNSFLNNTSVASRASGGSGIDTFTGGSGPDIYFGYGGNDRLSGRFGNDILYGGDGNDLIDGGEGNDVIYGGSGEDNIIGAGGNDNLYGEGDADLIQGGLGGDRIYGGSGADKLAGHSITNSSDADSGNMIDGESGDDLLMGAGGVDTLTGGPDNDVLFGGGGDDALAGNDGNDRLSGEAGDDNLVGGNGNDYLLGGIGADMLYGNDGRDYLAGGIGLDTHVGGLGVDTIVSVDGAADFVYPGTSAMADSRDELWGDSLDKLANIVAFDSAAANDVDAVHVIGSYRSYTVGGVNHTIPLGLAQSNFADPTIQSDDAALSPFKLSYATKPLFSSAGPEYTDIDQGKVGTCYFLARLASMAETFPQYIRDMVTELGDGTYVVQFHYQNGGRAFVRVDGDLYTYGSQPLYARLGAESSIWVAIVEKAWAIHRYGTASYNDVNGGNSVETNTAIALGLKQLKVENNLLPTPAIMTSFIKTNLDMGRSVIVSAPAALSNSIPLTAANKTNGEHVFMVHSVEQVNGQISKIKLYNLYGDSLVEITNFDALHWCVSSVVASWPK